MKMFSKFLEVAYAVIGVFFLIDGVLTWTDDREKAYISIAFGLVAIGMFFFKRNFRKKRS